jgi:aminopeptidase YwaD
MNKYSLILFSALFSFFSTYAQDMKRVHRYLDTLCASGLHGRGAGFDGQKKAANYLSDRFREIGLSSFSDNYFQNFNYDINTFPGTVFLQADGSTLIPGKDYIVGSASPSGKATLKILVLDTLIFTSKKYQKKFLAINVKKFALVYDEVFERKLKKDSTKIIEKKLENASCVVILKDKKLTMGLSGVQEKTVVFEVLKEKFNANTKTISYELKAELIKNYKAQNIIGYVKGTAVPDSFLFITAHYDHLGTLGSTTFFSGANDNASGVSMLLELARYFKEHSQRYSIVFIAFGAEEAGLIGSKYFTENPLVPLKKIRFLLNLDLMGTGDDGMMVVNGTVFPKEFSLLTKINDEKIHLPNIKKRGKAANSDHYYFSEKGVPAFFFYTLGGITAYHDVFDVPETLPLTKFKEVHQLIIEFVTSLTK